jgi:hypothetical protein
MLPPNFDYDNNYLRKENSLDSQNTVQGTMSQEDRELYYKHQQQMREEKIFILRHLRVEMDRVLKALRNEVEPTRAISLSITSLELSRMWLGKALKIFGEPYPYPESMDPKSAKIEPSADVSDDGMESIIPAELHGQGIKSQVAILKHLRSILTGHTNQTFQIVNTIAGFEASFAYQHVVEANMWLGVRLGELK